MIRFLLQPNGTLDTMQSNCYLAEETDYHSYPSSIYWALKYARYFNKQFIGNLALNYAAKRPGEELWIFSI